MPTQEQLYRLLEKYASGDCTPDEIRQLETWFDRIGNRSVEELDECDEQQMLRAFQNNPCFRKRRSLIFKLPAWQNIGVAVSVVGIFLVAGLWFSKSRNQAQTTTTKIDIQPGRNTAILTLADGRKVILDSTDNGKIATQPGIVITKTQSGRLIYTVVNTPESSATKAISYNTITTPSGGQYQIVLPDDSQVWLNAGSSMRFPTAFASDERRVEITGEAYFEVASNPKKPFLVISENQTAEVLGTRFNISAYSNEPAIKTTVLEGSVKVSTTDNNQKILTPGQHTLFSAGSLTVGAANTEEAIAWKNGYFRFNNETIESIMRQLSRWYSIEVDYKGPISREGFNGRVSRSKNISQVLNMLERTQGVHFKIEGRRVTVMQ